MLSVITKYLKNAAPIFVLLPVILTYAPDVSAESSKKQDAAGGAGVKQESPLVVPAESTLLGIQVDKSQSDFDVAVDDIQKNVYGHLLRTTRVTSATEVLNNGDGTADVLVSVSYSVDPEPIRKTLRQYFVLREKNEHILISSLDDFPLPYSARLFERLLEQQVVIRATVGAYSSYVVIASNEECAGFCIASGRLGYDIRWAYNDAKGHPLRADMGKHLYTPIVIAKIPLADIKAATKVTVIIDLNQVPEADRR